MSKHATSDQARAAAEAGAARKKMPLTVSRPEVLRDGSDRQFRKLVHAMFAFLSRHEAVRTGHAARIGLAGVEYTILISIGHLHAEEGSVTVNRLAAHLYLSGPFVTSVTNKLMKLGLVSKEPDTEDRRRVQLAVTAQGWKLLASLAPTQRQVNDVQFDPLSSEDFDTLLSVMEKLIESSERAIKLQAFLKNESADVIAATR